MAKTRAIARPTIVVMPRRGGALRRRAGHAVRRVGHHARRGVHHARKAAAPTTLILASAAVGYAQSKGYLNKLPTIGGSRALTLAVAGYAATRFVRHPFVRTAGLAAMVAGAFDWGRVQGGGTSGIDGDTEGDTEGAEGETEGDDGGY